MAARVAEVAEHLGLGEPAITRTLLPPVSLEPPGVAADGGANTRTSSPLKGDKFSLQHVTQ